MVLTTTQGDTPWSPVDKQDICDIDTGDKQVTCDIDTGDKQVTCDIDKDD
jgi:hypothetical protein